MNKKQTLDDYGVPENGGSLTAYFIIGIQARLGWLHNEGVEHDAPEVMSLQKQRSALYETLYAEDANNEAT